MADINRLVRMILNDKKLKNSRNFEAGVYRDEPILHTAAQMKNYTPPRYAEMKKIARSREAMNRPASWIFYQQGKFMEDFEDNCPFRGEFFRYYPTYQTMYNAELRGFFTWRTAVRHGQIERTSLSFVYLYLYELINQIGVRTPEEGFETLYQFWQSYRALEPSIDWNVKRWLADYVAYYGLDRALLDRFLDLSFERNLLVLLHAGDSPAQEVFQALAALSSYRVDKSRFYKKYREDVQAVTCAVFEAWSAYYAKNRKRSLLEHLFKQNKICRYSVFDSAVFYDRRQYRDYTYTVNEIHTYICKNGRWVCERYDCPRGRNNELGAMLRAVDCMMRQKYGFGSPLKEEPVTKFLREMILTEIDRHLERKRREAAPKIEIDVSKLQGIRRAADVTRDKLIVDEEPDEEPVSEAPPPQAEPETAENDAGLTGVEVRYLRALLCGGDPGAVLREAGVPESVLVDAVNEKLFDRFGDTVLLFDGDAPEPIEDYMEELKGIIGR